MVAAVVAALAVVPAGAGAADAKRPAQPNARGYRLVQQKCTGCHVSVADPERPGKTRDEWYAVVRLMASHGFKLSDQEVEDIVDHLYALRRGVEKDAG